MSNNTYKRASFQNKQKRLLTKRCFFIPAFSRHRYNIRHEIFHQAGSRERKPPSLYVHIWSHRPVVEAVLLVA